jgi:hypothetical protein
MEQKDKSIFKGTRIDIWKLVMTRYNATRKPNISAKKELKRNNNNNNKK